jgi:hypothetical protein
LPLLAIVAVGAATGGLAFAQTTGTIEGIVSDTSGAALPGVTCTATSPALQGSRSAVTGNSGIYRLVAVPPGDYKVSCALAGFSTAENTSVRVELGRTANVPFTLSISAREEVIVTGEAPVIDISRNVVGTTATAAVLSKLPLGRGFTSIAYRAPGTSTDVGETSGAGGNITVYGSTSLENQYIIDGVNTTGIKLGDTGKSLIGNFVQEVEVKTGGYEAEYGRALGGVVNVITKSGGNEFHGGVFGFYDNESLAADDKRADERRDVGSGKLTLPERLDLGLDLGGYFVKDYVWFFGAYDRVKRDEDFERSLDREGTLGTGTQEDTTDLYAGKLTFRLGAANTITTSVFGDPGERDKGRVAIIGPDHAALNKTKTGGTDGTAKYDGVFGSRFLAQAQFAYHEQKNDLEPFDPSAANRVALFRTQTGFLTEYLPESGYAGLITDEKYKRYAYRLAGSAFLGAHEFKVGGDYERLESHFEQGFTGPEGGRGRIQVRFTASGAPRPPYQHRYYAVVPIGLNCLEKSDGTVPAPGEFVGLFDCRGYRVAETNFADPDTRNLALFAQDSWKILKNLTVNAGMRYEEQELKRFDGTTVVDLKDMWSPRFGIVWDPLNNGRSKVFGSYGRFYTTIPQDVQTRSLGREATIIVFSNNATGVLDPTEDVLDSALFAQTGDAVDPGLKGMYQDEFFAGVEYEVARNWAVGVKGVYKALGRVVEDRCDLAANPDMRKFGPESSDPDIRRNQPTCALINPADREIGQLRDPANPDCYPNGYVDEDGAILPSSPCESVHASRHYRALELTVNHRFSDNFFVQSSYIYSQLNGNYTGNLSQTREGGQFDPNINADFDYPGLLTNAYGLLRNDQEHQFKLTGFYSFPIGLSVGANFTYASGRPYSIRGCPPDIYTCESAGYSQEGYLGFPRGGAGRLPDVYEADLHLSYALQIGPVTVSPVVDVFNVLNRQGVLSREELYNNQSSVEDNAPCEDGTFKNECAPNPNFGKDIIWQNPRLIRVGARVSF